VADPALRADRPPQVTYAVTERVLELDGVMSELDRIAERWYGKGGKPADGESNGRSGAGASRRRGASWLTGGPSSAGDRPVSRSCSLRSAPLYPNDGVGVTFVELLGGLAIFVGAFVEVVSVPLIVMMLVAMFTVHLKYRFSSINTIGLTQDGPRFGPPGYEVNLLYIAGCSR